MNTDDVTLCIPCYNVADVLPRTLDAVDALEPGPDRVVCIDDGSQDDLEETIDEYDWVDLVRHDRNRGLAAARNTALKTTDTAGLAMIDADVIVESDWLGELVAAMNEYEAAVCGGRLEEHVTTWADRWRALHMSQHFGDGPQSRDWVVGANALYRVEALQAVEGWDEQYRTNYEDVDIGNRLTEAGYEIRYVPGARATHYRTDTVLSALETAWAWTFRYRNEPESVTDLPARAIQHVRRTGGEVYTDVDTASWDLVPISLLKPFVFIKQDIVHL